ncbi:MAG: hypothetical protein ABI700_09290 [Chloroflexota bacterium]
MTTPSGTLTADFNQSKRQMKRVFAILAVVTGAAALFALAIAFSSKSPGNASFPLFLLIIPAVPGVGLLIAGVNAFKPPQKLEIYPDGFVLRDLKSNAVVDEALWSEVSDITIFDRKKARSAFYADAAGQAFGFIAQLLVASAADGEGGKPDRNLFIHLPKKKITLDNSYSNPNPPDDKIFSATRAIWLDQTTRALDAGQTIPFGQVELTPTGVKSGKSFAPWDTIIEAKYLDETGIVGIVWRDPAKKNEQIMKTPIGYRGETLIQMINQKTGRKTESLVSKLGTL